MSHHRRIYLAGPLGFSEFGRTGQAELIHMLIDLGYKVVDPFALAPTDEIERIARLTSLDAQRDAWRDLNLRIGENNCKAIDACDALLAVLDGQEVDSGAAAEIGYAFARGKTILGYRGDFRLAADNIGSIVNLQVEYFIIASGGMIVATISEIAPSLVRLFSPENERSPHCVATSISEA
jgi:nucleoside 2-deoxyribosyltransferase